MEKKPRFWGHDLGLNLGFLGWVLQVELGDVMGELWHIWESLKANFNGGKITHFKVGIQVHEIRKNETNLH